MGKLKIVDIKELVDFSYCSLFWKKKIDADRMDNTGLYQNNSPCKKINLTRIFSFGLGIIFIAWGIYKIVVK